MTPKNHIGAFTDPATQEMLQKCNSELTQRPLARLLLEAGRFERFSARFEDLLYDHTRVHLDDAALGSLLAIAEASGVSGRRDALFAGEHVNATEDRPALHMALRSPEVLNAVGGAEAARVTAAMDRLFGFAETLQEGKLPLGGDRPVTDLVHVGIGGSLLGTQLVCEALATGSESLRVHFLGSVDAVRRERLLRQLDPASTAVILVSKSFSTGDTLLHGRRLRNWLEAALGREEAHRRLFAVTSQVERADAFGIAEERLLYFSDWVGGRYSLWSPVSLAAAALVGPERFQALLVGAASMDQHFREAPLDRNLPVLAALVGVWHRNVCGFAAWGCMPYDQRLKLLPAYLQQLIMESNGKSVRAGGEPSALATAAVVFGETGTEAQHSVFQAMHQGSDIVPLNFVAIARPDHDDDEAQDELLANLLAQLTALAAGRDAEATRAELGDIEAGLLRQRTFGGNRPSELLMLDELTPGSLGRLLAFYEHKVFVESVLWDINAFDQWGVELGKTLAPGIQAALAGSGEPGGGLEGLLRELRQLRSKD
ncbi:MAG: glucose-6-phosphate isomerase [Pseudomonadota bacterium]